MMKTYRMNLIGKTLSVVVLMTTLLIAPTLIASTPNAAVETKKVVVDRVADEAAAVVAEAGMLYNAMELENRGLPKKAFEYAFKGYKNLVNRGLVEKTNIISVADFSQSSRNKRLFILDLESQKVLMQTYVAHGRGSGGEYARSFSNTPETHKSSLGFYVTKNTYFGQHGLSLILGGVEKGINDNAEARKIVIHGANYVGDRYLKVRPFIGRSHGCPAVASKLSKNVIETIKDGSVLFIYHPTISYLNKSRILNG
ncbi:MAG TPA: murein L,D-transpeptidase catalytic domain family protein [Chitinophagaceae bacterium]|nr:murein L,D-transpeptidase catalytic domain family protein [Chitinophagaceae bacterium]